jgi:glycosyltransferase involved in cell wall biosynthesis
MLNDNYTCWMVPDELFDQWLPAWMTSVRPDLVLTQLEDSHRVIPLACQQGNPVFHFVHDTHVLNELSLAQSALLAHVFFNSHFTASTYQGRIQAPSTVLYPAIEHGHYTVSARKPRFITMINPVARKGVHLLDALIKCFPHEPFLLVPGWEPLEIDISCYPHVVLSERTWPDAMQTVYAQTKLLLVPSQYEESFGRVAAEALFSGIPVVASRVGGLPEAIGSGGWLIDDYTEPSAWIKTLAHVLALPPSEWQLRGTAGRAYVQQFAIDRIGTTFERLLLTSWQRTRDPLVRRDISSFI